MTRPRRWRWWGKWATLTVAAAIALVWLASGWYYADVLWSREPRGAARLYAQWGAVGWSSGPTEPYPYQWTAPGTYAGIRRDPNSQSLGKPIWSWGWWFHFYCGTEGIAAVVPLWALFLPFAASAICLWCLDRPPIPGYCPRCRYNLSATPPSAPCPECGAEQSLPSAPATSAGSGNNAGD
jgi:hypothetical protein